jgi:DNA (cytosine-5)-methyltransferase 1
MGFPDNFKIPVSDAQAWKQFGNSVVIDLVEKIFIKINDTNILENDYNDIVEEEVC